LEIFLGIILFMVMWYVYDKYIQRKHQLLVNYPIIGRLRYVLEEYREPFRQYFGNEHFYESKDKLDWVYKAARDLPNYSSFSPTQPLPKPKFMLRHSTIVLNDDEISNDFSVTFGENRKKPYTSKSIISRAGMSDGAISPEGTRAFARGAFEGDFPINTGEGSLTSNFFVTQTKLDKDYMELVEGTTFQKKIKQMIKKISNPYIASKVYRKLVFKGDPIDESYVFNRENLIFHRINWNAPLEKFPKDVPEDVADIIFQMSSGLYGVRDKDGSFNEERYKKVMRFCKMTEIKLAQGAKQTGGKLIGKKVTPAIAYYRGVEAGKDLFSPNRFPFANSIAELFDFVGKLQNLSEKPVGIKIVISDYNNIVPIVEEIKKRIDENNNAYPDFISIDGGSGGSATAPIELMERIGLNSKDATYLTDKVLKEYGIRDKVKILSSGKVLTPDDVVILKALGADLVQVARGFMMSAGCIRARYCSGTNGKVCPVGLATQDKAARARFFEKKYSGYVANYHQNLLKGIKTILAVMGLENINQLTKDNLIFLDKNSKVHDDIDGVFSRILKLKHKE
jgi:glutamate synthase domain-containing protein 2